MELENTSVRLDGMAGVRAAIRPDNDVCICCQCIGELAFALVTPLATHDDGRWHPADPFSGVTRLCAVIVRSGCAGQTVPAAAQ